MHEPQSELVLVYEPAQVAELLLYIKNNPTAQVLSLDAEIDWKLEAAGVAFISARQYREGAKDHFLRAEQLARTLESEAWCNVSYKGVALAKPIIPTVQGYFIGAFYYVNLLVRVLEAHPQFSTLSILRTTRSVPAAGAFIAAKEIHLIEECAELVGSVRGLVVRFVGSVRESLPVSTTLAASLSRKAVGLGMFLLNIAVTLLRPRKEFRILVSDYWRHVAPVLPELPHAEFIFTDKREALNAGWKNIWKYRIRFRHLHEFTGRNRKDQKKAIQELRHAWREIKQSRLSACVVGGMDVISLFVSILDEFFAKGLPRMLEEIEEVDALLSATRPDVVLLRASVSGQWHFPLLALLAKERGIPSFELLHGMEYLGAGSIDKWHVAEYLGVYGKHTQVQMQHVGFPAEKLPIIGSPRFDEYELKGLAQARENHAMDEQVVFITAPDFFHGATFDTYDIEAYFYSIAHALRDLPQVRPLIKLRAGPLREAFYRQAVANAFSGMSYEIAQYESLKELFPKAAFAISCQSTVTLEALQCGVPLILYAETPVEALMLTSNFADAGEVGAVRLATTPETLLASAHALAQDARIRVSLTDKSLAYLEEQFAFDGKASVRTAEFLAKLAYQHVHPNAE